MVKCMFGVDGDCNGTNLLLERAFALLGRGGDIDDLELEGAGEG